MTPKVQEKTTIYRYIGVYKNLKLKCIKGCNQWSEKTMHRMGENIWKYYIICDKKLIFIPYKPTTKIKQPNFKIGKGHESTFLQRR